MWLRTKNLKIELKHNLSANPTFLSSWVNKIALSSALEYKKNDKDSWFNLDHKLSSCSL